MRNGKSCLTAALCLALAGAGWADETTTASAASASESSSAESDELQFHPGLTFGTVTVDGKTWTRLSLQPEISIWKLGVALDLEVFMDENQKLSDRGWDFNTTENTVSSLLRKIYYVRWDKPGAPVYARVGALDGITMGHGLVVNGYRNTANYPGDKLLGVNAQLNDIGSLGWSAEVLVNSVQDFSKKGPFWAASLGFRPLKPTGIPLFRDLLVSGGVARDESQYSGLRDRDGDGIPDLVDLYADDASRSVKDMSYLINDVTVIPDSVTAGAARQKIADTTKAIEDSISRAYSRKMTFTEVWGGATLPIVQTDLLKVSAYTEFAKPLTPDDDSVAGLGWGAIPLGAEATFGPFRATAEYRSFKAPFQPGWFDANYELDRATLSGSAIKTKTEVVYSRSQAAEGYYNGYFAGVGANLWGFIDVSGNYSQLLSSRDNPDQRSLGAKIALGSNITSLLRNKISCAELYWRKDRVGLDRWTDTAGGVHKDSFFGKSIYTTYGWRVGSQISDGAEIIFQRETTFDRRDDGSLKPQTQMSIASQVTF